MLTIEIQSAPAHPIITEVLLVSFLFVQDQTTRLIPIGSRTPCDECICLVTGVNGQGVGRLLLWIVYNGP